MPRIVHIQRYAPDPEGIGGQHRIYQNHQDLVRHFGAAEVGVVSLRKEKKTDQRRWLPSRRVLRERLSCVRLVLRNRCSPTHVLLNLLNVITESRNPFGSISVGPYLSYIQKNGRPDVCVVDHPILAEIARYNQSSGIATLYVPQNIEAATGVADRLHDSFSRAYCALRWMAEMEILSLCHERLMISLPEVNFIRGLGVSAAYYPYVPVGEIRARSMGLRAERARSEIDRGLFLMVGTVSHAPIRESFRWLLGNVKAHGLPDGFRIVAGGEDGEGLRDEFGTVPGVEINGRLGQEDLNCLIRRASAVLVPQISGFGAVTRISEMACAGIPVVASDYALAAMQTPPGVLAVATDWGAWVKAMQAVSVDPLENSVEDYKTWESSQPNPVKQVIERYL